MLNIVRHPAVALTLCVLLLSHGGVAARQGPAQNPPAATFRVNVNQVEIDAIVTDPAGRFVRDLTEEDFEVYEDGRRQSVSTFDLVDLPMDRPDPPAVRRTPIEPDVRTNLEPFTGRVIALVLDDLHTGIGRTAAVRAAARQFLERHVRAEDLVAVLHAGGGARMSQDFTTNRRHLLDAIERFTGRKLMSATQALLDDHFVQRDSKMPRPIRDTHREERVNYARASIKTLHGVAESLATIRGRRKALVWFGEGVDYLTANLHTARDAMVVREEMSAAIAASTRAGVAIYAVDPRALGAAVNEALGVGALALDTEATIDTSDFMDEVRRSQEFLRTVSTETGGFAAVEQNSLSDTFERIIRDNSSYYVLGYSPHNNRRDGKFRRVQVRVKRTGLRVRARDGYTAPKGPATTTARDLKDSGASPEVREALTSVLPVSGLGLRLAAACFRGPGETSSVALSVEFDPVTLAFAESFGEFSDELELVIVPIDAEGKPRDGTRDVVPMKLSRGTYDRVRAYGIRLVRRLDLPPGRYMLRVAARSAQTKAVGSVVHAIDVPDFRTPPLAMSGIAIASGVAANIPTPTPPRDFLDLLPVVPTPLRDFVGGDVLQVFTEFYTNAASVPYRIALSTTVSADDSRNVFTASDEREMVGGGGAAQHAVNIPLSGLAPGRYVLRIDARALLTDGVTVSREVEFRVR